MPSQPPSLSGCCGVSLASERTIPCSKSECLSAEPEPDASASASSSVSSSSLSSRYASYRGPFPLPRASDRTTSPLQMGHVRRRVVSQGVLENVSVDSAYKTLGWTKTYMQSAWNSWPQGKLMTLLTPSTYSSRQTTHSTCRPMYFRHSAEKPPVPFSNSDRRLVRGD